MAGPTEIQTVPAARRLAVLTQLVAVGGPLNAVTLRLYKSAVTPSPGMVLADMVEADYDGYAAVAGLTWSSPFLDTDLSALLLGDDAPFICTGDTVPNTIYGWYLTNAGNTVLVAVFPFTTPIGVSQAGQACPVVPYFRYSGD